LGEDLAIDCRSFVQAISVRQFPDIETFETTRTFTGTGMEVGHSVLELTLYNVANGNVRPQSLDVASFNFD
jgi:hypothetical protein